MTNEKAAEYIESGMLLHISDKLMANIEADIERNAAMRAIEVQVRSGFYRHMTGIHPIETECVPDGLWQNVKMYLPFATPRMRKITTVLHSHNLCPHLIHEGKELHLKFLKGPELE